MNNHDFVLINADTDSIMVCKRDSSIFTKEERISLLKELNSLSPKGLNWDDDGYYETAIILKAKNYILYDGQTIKYKGSSLKSSTLEPALKDFLHEIIDAIISNENNFTEIYNKYVKEIDNIQDIKRWASKKTISEKTLNSPRANETKIMDAIEGSDYVEGDRVYVYFKPDGTLNLIEKFDGQYDKTVFLKKLYNTSLRFETIMNCNELFLNYSLKRNKIKFEEIIKC